MSKPVSQLSVSRRDEMMAELRLLIEALDRRVPQLARPVMEHAGGVIWKRPRSPLEPSSTRTRAPVMCALPEHEQ